MARFHYRAMDAEGQLREGELEADSAEQVAAQLDGMRLLPLKVSRVSTPRRRSGPGLFRRQRTQVGRDDVLHLTAELATLLDAGLPLDRALEVLMETSENPAAVAMIGEIREEVRGGASLAEALDSRQAVFGRLYVNMVRAGEAGGALEVVLQRLAEFLERSKELRATVSSAMIYPAILTGVAVISIIILMTFVVPQFAQLFEDLGEALPWSTRIVMSVADLFREDGWILLLVVMALVWLGRSLLQDEGRRRWLDGAMLAWPLVGDLIAKVETARFARTLGTLLQNGVHLLQGMEIVAGTLSNRAMAERLVAVTDSLREGKGVAETLGQGSGFPNFAIHMIRVGEESGQLEKMLLKVADVYDREVAATVKRMVALIEPVVILGMGVIIAMIILSILVAIMSVNDLAF